MGRELEEQEYDHYLALIENLEPFSGGHGTHCSDAVYKVSDNIIIQQLWCGSSDAGTLTIYTVQEWEDSQRPISYWIEKAQDKDLEEKLKHPRERVKPARKLDGAALIFNERQRQVQSEGWTAEHDAQYEDDELMNCWMQLCAT